MERAHGYSMAELRRDLAEDIEEYLGFAAEYAPDRRTAMKRLSALLTPSVLACLFYRISHWAHCRECRGLAWGVAWVNLQVTGAGIAPASRIGGGLYIPHPSTGLQFQATAGRRLKLFAGSGAGPGFMPLTADDLAGAPHLGDDVSLGSKAWVRGPVVVGSGARIAFNTVVSRDVPEGARVVCRYVRNRVVPPAPAGRS